MCRHSPAGFVNPDLIAAPDQHTELLVGRSSLFTDPLQGAADAAATHLQTITPFQDARHPHMRQPHFLVQVGRQGQRFRPQLDICGAQRTGGRQRATPLHVPPASATLADLDIKPTNDRGTDNLFLELRLGFSIIHASAAMETSARKRRMVSFVDARRNRPRTSGAILMAWLTAWWFGI